MISKKVAQTASIFVFITFILILELFYLNSFASLKSEDKEKKQAFVSLIALPDLALLQERSLRHRTLVNVFDIYPLDASLREYTKGSFVYSDAKIKEKI